MKKYLQKPVNPIKIKGAMTVNELISDMGNTAFQGKNLSLAVNIWEKMIKDKNVIFLGLAGAMVPAGMRNIIVYLIENRLIDCLVSTGANLFHDCHEILGYSHWQGHHQVNDLELYKEGIDRIYDVFASEKEFRETDLFIAKWAETIEQRAYTTREFLYLLGQHLSTVSKEKGILTAAAQHNVPIYCPALGDSSIGIALAVGRYKGSNHITFDIITDIIETAEIAVHASPHSGVIYIGGGTPKNFIQQTEVTASIEEDSPALGHKYAIQITADAPHWGGLSGCTFEEAQSWGKISNEADKVTLYSDATISLPIIVNALAERCKDIIPHRLFPEFTIGEKLEFTKL